MKPAPATDYDVVVIGGALAGAATALMLMRERPELRLLIIEKSPVFKRRVGEATVEVSAYFLTRVLGLMQHLNERHLVKQGLRFWFADSRARTIEDCSEIGGRYLARVPSFQIDRSKLKIDSNKVIETAVKEPILANLTITNTQLWLDRAGRDDDSPVWKIRLWAAKVRKPSDTVEIGDLYISAEDGKVIKNNLKIHRVD